MIRDIICFSLGNHEALYVPIWSSFHTLPLHHSLAKKYHLLVMRIWVLAEVKMSVMVMEMAMLVLMVRMMAVSLSSLGYLLLRIMVGSILALKQVLQVETS
jgi:hypothetical protein